MSSLISFLSEATTLFVIPGLIFYGLRQIQRDIRQSLEDSLNAEPKLQDEAFAKQEEKLEEIHLLRKEAFAGKIRYLNNLGLTNRPQQRRKLEAARRMGHGGRNG